jgi:hypothetical protein
MSTFEIWSNPSTPRVVDNQADHTIEAHHFDYRDGVFMFFDETNSRLHSIVATPAMFIRKLGIK